MSFENGAPAWTRSAHRRSSRQPAISGSTSRRRPRVKRALSVRSETPMALTNALRRREDDRDDAIGAALYSRARNRDPLGASLRSWLGRASISCRPRGCAHRADRRRDGQRAHSIDCSTPAGSRHAPGQQLCMTPKSRLARRSPRSRAFWAFAQPPTAVGFGVNGTRRSDRSASTSRTRCQKAGRRHKIFSVT